MIVAKFDADEVQEAIKETTLNYKTIIGKCLRLIGRKQSALLNKAIQGSVVSRSGELYKAYHYKAHVSDTEQRVVMWAYGKDRHSTIYPKLMTLNYGADIKPVKGKTLTFVSNDGRNQWCRTYGMTIAGRHFLEGAWQSYGASGAWQSDVDELLMSEINKYWK